MANEAKIDWDTLTDFGTLTNLNSLADGNVWQSGEITHADPGAIILRIWYELDFNTTPIAGDTLIFRMSYTDGGSTPEIWDGGIGTSESEITAPEEAQQGCARVHTHAWVTGHDVQFNGHFDVEMPSAGWQLLIEADGEALASSGNTVRYQYGHPQYQTS